MKETGVEQEREGVSMKETGARKRGVEGEKEGAERKVKGKAALTSISFEHCTRLCVH